MGKENKLTLPIKDPSEQLLLVKLDSQATHLIHQFTETFIAMPEFRKQLTEVYFGRTNTQENMNTISAKIVPFEHKQTPIKVKFSFSENLQYLRIELFNPPFTLEYNYLKLILQSKRNQDSTILFPIIQITGKRTGEPDVTDQNINDETAISSAREIVEFLIN